ncbi:hypothetical protein GIB67_041355 [Kingdonia uniflora]|uniref:pyruvate decarboxylase n=1 Tax=Kingdonia uniflora TaxID=39325 RepID=A0A7J7NJB8_9MAGN|nr:hypothetical protein GIB67_041355 [Kingdonia uniflora]
MQYRSIGWSVGATLGYAQAVPNKRVIACIGDGSFQVNIYIYCYDFMIYLSKTLSIFKVVEVIYTYFGGIGNSTGCLNDAEMWAEDHNIPD